MRPRFTPAWAVARLCRGGEPGSFGVRARRRARRAGMPSSTSRRTSDSRRRSSSAARRSTGSGCGRHPGRASVSGCHSWLRMNALPQWLKTWRTSTSATNHGCRPSTAQVSSSSGSRVRRAKPLTRSVSEMPGTTKSRPMPGRVTRFCTPSKRRLPGNSGTSRRVSASTATKPAGPPFGPASHDPSAPVVAITRNGEAAMNSRARSSSAGISLASTRGSGSPTSSHSCSVDEIACESASITQPV